MDWKQKIMALLGLNNIPTTAYCWYCKIGERYNQNHVSLKLPKIDNFLGLNILSKMPISLNEIIYRNNNSNMGKEILIKLCDF